MTAILTVRGLHARIAGQQVVEDVSFDVAATGVTALLGRNGVGKSSTIKALLGLYERTGEVTFDGDRIDRLMTHRIVQRGIAYVPEDREVFGQLTVEENLRLAERGGAPNRAIVGELFPELIERAILRSALDDLRGPALLALAGILAGTAGSLLSLSL